MKPSPKNSFFSFVSPAAITFLLRVVEPSNPSLSSMASSMNSSPCLIVRRSRESPYLLTVELLGILISGWRSWFSLRTDIKVSVWYEDLPFSRLIKLKINVNVGLTCSCKGKLERSRSWKDLSWKDFFKLERFLKLERFNLSLKDFFNLERFTLS